MAASEADESPKTRVVLVVEDDENIGSLLVDALNGEPGFQAIRAPDAAVALETLVGVQVDLVLLDLELPGISGMDFLDQFRARPNHEKTPVIIVSASAKKHSDEIRERGVAFYVTKPFDLNNLLGLVRGLFPSHADS